MFHEMSIYTTVSGQLPAFTQSFREKTLVLRLQFGGRFKGAWTSEFGLLNTLVVLWEFDDLIQRETTTVLMESSEEWTAHSRALTPSLASVETLLLRPHRQINRRPDDGRMYDFRIYDIKPFHAQTYAKHLAGVLPVREKHSKNFCVWTPAAGNMNRVVHLWPYEDPDQRLDVRVSVAAEPEWQVFVSKVFPLIVHQRSSMLRPVMNLYQG